MLRHAAPLEETQQLPDPVNKLLTDPLYTIHVLGLGTRGPFLNASAFAASLPAGYSTPPAELLRSGLTFRKWHLESGRSLGPLKGILGLKSQSASPAIQLMGSQPTWGQ